MSVFNFRVDDELKDAFLQACKDTDRSASQLIRGHMREYIQAHPIAGTGFRVCPLSNRVLEDNGERLERACLKEDFTFDCAFKSI